MKKILILMVLLFFFLFIGSNLKAQTIMLSGGYNWNNYIGAGNAENTFNFTSGYCFEFGVYNKTNGFSWILYGISGCSGTNSVKSSTANVSIFTPWFTELRFTLEKNIGLFAFLGFDFNRMHFDNMNGDNNQYLITTGIGAYIYIGNNVYIQPKIKPYVIIGNSLGQSFGCALQLNMGLSI